MEPDQGLRRIPLSCDLATVRVQTVDSDENVRALPALRKSGDERLVVMIGRAAPAWCANFRHRILLPTRLDVPAVAFVRPDLGLQQYTRLTFKTLSGSKLVHVLTRAGQFDRRGRLTLQTCPLPPAKSCIPLSILLVVIAFGGIHLLAHLRVCDRCPAPQGPNRVLEQRAERLLVKRKIGGQ